MPDEQQPESPAGEDDAMNDIELPTSGAASHDDDAAPAKVPGTESSGGPVFSGYGLVSTALALVSVAAVVVGLITWSMHRSDVDERAYRSRVLQTAATWTSVLINLNAENVEKGMQRLRDKTVGSLNAEFDAAVQPYRDVVQRIQSRSTGRIEAAAIESVHHDLDSESDAQSADQAVQPPSPEGGRTDAVMVLATSVAENVGGKPQTVHWALQLDVSDVDGQLLISRLRSIR
ncbi:MAG TPA: hypothetical protein VFQ37_02145 [Mycobacterium sp.]|nr:hypothetical protein [Mycobacterium sp.]